MNPAVERPDPTGMLDNQDAVVGGIPASRQIGKQTATDWGLQLLPSVLACSLRSDTNLSVLFQPYHLDV